MFGRARSARGRGSRRERCAARGGGRRCLPRGAGCARARARGERGSRHGVCGGARGVAAGGAATHQAVVVVLNCCSRWKRAVPERSPTDFAFLMACGTPSAVGVGPPAPRLGAERPRGVLGRGGAEGPRPCACLESGGPRAASQAAERRARGRRAAPRRSCPAITSRNPSASAPTSAPLPGGRDLMS